MKKEPVEIKIERIKSQLVKIQNLRPGSLSKQYSVCGAKQCRCQDPKNPQKHGPYWKLSFVVAGKNKTQFIREPLVETIQNELREFKKFKALTQQWISLEIERSNQWMQSRIEENERQNQKTKTKS